MVSPERNLKYTKKYLAVILQSLILIGENNLNEMNDDKTNCVEQLTIKCDFQVRFKKDRG